MVFKKKLSDAAKWRPRRWMWYLSLKTLLRGNSTHIFIIFNHAYRKYNGIPQFVAFGSVQNSTSDRETQRLLQIGSKLMEHI